jgi:hypothetical protein
VGIGQVNEGVEVGSVPNVQLVKNPVSTHWQFRDSVPLKAREIETPMKREVCLEYIRLKQREEQCRETSVYFGKHSDFGELSKRATERYRQWSLQAHKECIEHAKRCPVCKVSPVRFDMENK